MEYVIGIDGGGTKTKLTMCDVEGNVLYTTTSGPSNILSSGYEVAKCSIIQVIEQGMEQSGYGKESCLALCIGVAGAGREEVKKQIETIIRETGYKKKVIITHDAETALVGGTGGTEGILIIAGTGTICYGKTKEGKTHRVSGWGHIIGDEGSAYSIGIKILNAVMKAYDGRGKETILTTLVLEYMGMDTPDKIIGYIYKPEVTKQHIAGIAILIDAACRMDDEVAFKVIDETIEELYACVVASINRLGFKEKKVKVVSNGSVLVNNVYVNKGFRERLQQTYPLVEVTTMLHDASYGAALIALEAK